MSWLDYIRSKLPVFQGERLGPNDLPSNIVNDLRDEGQRFVQRKRNRDERDYYDQDIMGGSFQHELSIEKEFEEAFYEMDSMFKAFLGGEPIVDGRLGGPQTNQNIDNFFHGPNSDNDENNIIRGFFSGGPLFGGISIFHGDSRSDRNNERNMRDFFSGPIFGIGSIFEGFRDDSEDSDVFGNFSGSFSQIEPFQSESSNDEGNSLRKRMLNEDLKDQLASPHQNDDSHSDEFTLRFHTPFIGNDRHNDIKGDQDLDKEIESGKSLDDILFDQNKSNVQRAPSFSSVFKSSSVSKKINPDGSVETTTRRHHSDGIEEVVISRKIGEQTHTVTTKKNKVGEKEKIESFVNMKEKDLEGFDRKWNKGSKLLGPDQHSVVNNLPDSFSFWSKPKL